MPLKNFKLFPNDPTLSAALFALFALVHSPVAAQTTYTWTGTAGGSQSWSTGSNWSGGSVPNPVAGDTVDFSTINLAANAALTLDADRTAGIWKFGDTSGSQTWTVSAGNTMTLAGTTPTIHVNNGTTTLNNVLVGANGFTKTGAGTLTITGANTFSGDVTISAGTLTGLNSTTLAQAGSLIFTGTGAATTAYGNQIFTQGMTVNSGVTATFNFPSNAYAFRFNGPVSGNGTIAVTGASAQGVYLGLYNTANTFAGTLSNPGGNSTIGGFRVGSLADSANPIRLGGGALELVTGGVALSFDNRRIELTGTTTGATLINNASSAASTFTINTDLLVTGVGNKMLTFSGSNTSANAFSGLIADGVGSVISVAKTGAGMWHVAGSGNNYTGMTTISGGTLAATTMGNVGGGASSLGAPVTIANGTIALGSGTTAGTLRYQGTGNTSDRVFNLAGTTGGGGLSHMGTGLWKLTSNLTATGAGTKTLTLQGSTAGIGEIAGSIVDNSITNLTAVTKSGTGTWELSGTNTYTGDTVISGGVLKAAEGVGLPASSLLTLNGGAFESVGNFARVAGNSAGKIRLIGGASGFSARGGDVQVAIGTLVSPAALVMGSATFVPNTLVLNADTADSKITFLNPVSISGFNFQVSVGAATAEMSGVISGDLTGSVTKTGNGTLILSGINTFQGNAHVSSGTLSLTRPNLSQYTNVTVANGAVLNLNFTGTTSVASLTLGDVPKAPGAYNSTNAAPFITGTGVIYVNGGDADEDGMPDGWELLYGFNPNDPADATTDLDGDGLTNLEEYVAATGPNVGDTDGDGLTDGQELHGIIVGDDVLFLGTSPLNPDTDGDGVTDGEEVTAGSSPLLVDTDSDGAPDWYEVKAAFTNPANAASKPVVPYPLPRPNGFAGVTNKPVKVFILSGQSNMVGMGRLDSLGTPGTLSTIVKQQGKFPNLVDQNGNWSVMNNVYYRGVVTAIGDGPMTAGFGANAERFGPELGFGHVMGYANDGPVLIIKASQGNRGIGWDILPPGSPRFNSGSSTYAGYGDSPQSWLTATGSPALGGWYAGKQYDDFFLAEGSMGAKGWTDATAYPAGCQVVHNGVGYVSKSAHASSPVSEPGVGAQSATHWDFYAIENVTDILDNFATEYPQWAAQGFEIAGYAWFQGHWDSQNAVYADRYETNMVQVIKSVRQYYEARYPAQTTANAPFVLSTIGFDGWNMAGNYLTVANAQLAVSDPAKYPEFAGNVKTMESRSYWRDVSISPKEEGYHYNLNAETYMLVGDALGRGMLELMGGVIDTTPPVLSTLNPATTATNVATAANFVATFNEVIVAGTGNILLKNLTDATSTSIPVTDAAQVTAFGSVLTINPTSYLKPNKQYAIQIPGGAIKDYAGNPFAGINNDVTWTFTTGQGDSLTASLIALTDHVNGVSILTSEQIAAHKVTIEGLKDRLGEDEVIIASAFDLVRAYDTVYGALWVASGQMTRSAETGNLQWTIYRVMQAIMDYVYTRGNIVAFPELINGFKFNSSSNFPGVCPVPPANGVYTVAVNASFPDTFGRHTQGWTERARRPTGAYLAPGTMATVSVPAALVNAGYKIRVGAHSWDFSNKPYIKRLDRSTLLFDIIGTDVKIASPLGGGIYIEAPMNANAGVVNVTITGAARAPFFQNTSFHETTLAEWLATERTNPAPWADFQTDKFMMQVPRSFIYAHPDPLTVLNDWDASMDAINDLMGFPHIRGKDTMYLQVDVFNRASVYAPGYPTVNNSYSATTDYGGYLNNYLVRGPQYSPDYTFHEQGHSYFFTKFGGESESTVNLLYVPVLNQKFGYTMDAAFRRSFSTYNSNIPDVGFKDNVARLWMTSFNFSPREVAMADWEKAYQHQGHAKFVDIAQLYGWGTLNSFWYYYNYNDTNNITVPKDNDSLMVKLCESAGADVRPLLHFWGTPPSNAANVASQVAGLGLTPPTEIYDLLMHYKSLVPTNNTSYQAFCLLYYGRQPTMGGAGVEREHARQWDTTALYGVGDQQRNDATNPGEIYNENSFADITGRVQEIIDLYYPNGRPPSNNAKLADLQPSLGALSPGFNGTTFSYSNIVPYSATSMTITPVASDPSATITVNSVPVASGSPSAMIDVSAASTNISIVVVSSDTTTTHTYTVTVTHAVASANANLASLVPSAGTLNPAFASGITSYTATVPYAVSSVTITPTAAQSGANITVNGSPVASGAAAESIALNVGSNIITTVVVAEDLVTTKNYTLTVQRTANAGLSSLVPSAGTLAPAFNTTTFNYAAAVPFGTSSMTVTPISADPAATITVNGSPVSTGTPSGAISLIVGTNVITTVVVSADASATNTYVLSVTRVAPGSRWWDGGTANIAGNGNAASAGNVGTWDTTIENWDQGSNLAHAAWFNGNDDLAVFAGTAGTVTLGTNVSASGVRFDTASYVLSGGTLTLTSIATVTANANATINSIIAGTNGLTKSGSGTLTLGATTNTYTGGTFLNAGTLTISADIALGASGSRNVTFAGNAMLSGTSGPHNLDGLTINTNITATIQGAVTYNFSGVVSGNGKLATLGVGGGGSVTINLLNQNNTFTGPIAYTLDRPGTINFRSLADSPTATPITFQQTGQTANFIMDAAAGANIALTNRYLQITGSSQSIMIANNSTTKTLSFHSDLQVTGSGTPTINFNGQPGGINEFAGVITNGTATALNINVGPYIAGQGTSAQWYFSNTNNTYTGTTTIGYGSPTLIVNTIANNNVASSLGRSGVISIAAGGGTGAARLIFVGAGSTSDRTFQIGAGGNSLGSYLLNNGTGALTFTGSYFNDPSGATATRTLTLGGTYTASPNEIQGIIRNNTGQTLALTKQDAGTWLLSGSNTYTGATAVQGGTLIAGSADAFGNVTSEINLGVAGGNSDAGILVGGPLNVARIIRLLSNNTTDTGTRILTLGGNTADASEFSGNIFLGTTNQAGRGLTLTAASGGQVTFSGVIQNPSGMDATTYTVTKAGPGTVVLSNTNTYTGATTVNAGTLFINGSIGAGTLSVSANATLGGTGTIGGSTTIAANGKLEFDLSTNAGSHDKLDLAVGKTLAFSGASVLTITSTSGASPGAYTLVTAPGGITGNAPATLNLPAGWAATVSKVGNDLVLNVTSTGGPGPVDHFVISAIASPQTVGTPITGITLTAQDSTNQTATSFTGTVTFGGTGGFSGTSASFVAGVLSGVSVTPTVAGSNLTLTVNDGASHTGSTTITTIQTQYEAWSGGAAFDADTNGDGVNNGLAFLLGAGDVNVSALDRLPVVSQVGGNLQMTFSIMNSANRGTATLQVQHSSDLGISDPWTAVEVPDSTGGPTSGVSFTVTPGNPTNIVTVTISSSEAAFGKLFGRLRAETP